MNEQLFPDMKRNARYLSVVLAMLAIFLAVKSLDAWRTYWGTTLPAGGPTISVEGKGELFVQPDIAQFSFGVEAKAKTVADAQKEVSRVANAAIDYLKKAGVAEKDIKTDNYSFYPEYDYVTSDVLCVKNGICPPQGKQVLSGYRVNETVNVKLRNPDKAGEVVDGLGSLAVTNVSGISFVQEDENASKESARELAIKDAKSKAEILARELGVRLVRITSFSESGFFPYYAKAESLSAPANAGAVAPTTLPVGENKVTSTVTLVYEIR